MWLLWAGVACGPVAFYERVREACAVNDGTPLPWGLEGIYVGIDKTCAASLGDAVRLDWKSFGEVPHDIAEPITGTDLLIGGLYTLVSSDLGTVGELEATLQPGELLAAQFPHGLAASGLRADDPAGAFWLDYVATRVASVRFEAGSECTLELAAYDVVEACLDSAEEFPVEYEGHPGKLASALVHEAGHVDGPDHDGGPAGTWDTNAGGTVGLQARWLDGWVTADEGRAPASDTNELAYYRWLVCTYIEEPGDFEPCQ